MATVLGVLVGFGMFGAMLTLPLYLQIVARRDADRGGLAHDPDDPRPDDLVDRLRPDHLAHRPLPDLPDHRHRRAGRRLLPADVLDARQAGHLHDGRDVPDRPRPRPADADPHPRHPERGRTARHGRRHQLVDLLPPDRWNPGRRDPVLGAVQRLPGAIGDSFKDKALLTDALDAALNPTVACAQNNRRSSRRSTTRSSSRSSRSGRRGSTSATPRRAARSSTRSSRTSTPPARRPARRPHRLARRRHLVPERRRPRARRRRSSRASPTRP